jgi:O-acetyl-ADP-ribose deacetylase (regulator of RNase III)
MGRDLRTNALYIKNSTQNSLKRAEELKLKSIAFPAIGTGVGGFPIEECAKVMISTVKDYLPQTKSIQRVIFALFDEQGYEVFEDEMKRITQ